MKVVNRMAIIVRPKEPYYAWAKSLEPASPIDLLPARARCGVFLVDKKDMLDPEKVLRRHYASIFVARLNDWWRQESAWPRQRAWELFQHWFEAEVIEMIIDVSKRPLETEGE